MLHIPRTPWELQEVLTKVKGISFLFMCLFVCECLCVCFAVGLERREKEGENGSSPSSAGKMHHDAPHSLQGKNDLGPFHIDHIYLKN